MDQERGHLGAADLIAGIGLVFTFIQTALQVFSMGENTESLCFVSGNARLLWIVALPPIVASGMLFGAMLGSVSDGANTSIRVILVLSSFFVALIVISSAWHSAGCAASVAFSGSGSNGHIQAAIRLALSVLTFAGFAYMVCGRLAVTPPSSMASSRRRGDAVMVFCGIGALGALVLAFSDQGLST